MSHQIDESNTNSATGKKHQNSRPNARPGQEKQAREAPRQGGAASGVPDKDSAPEKTPGQGTGIGGR